VFLRTHLACPPPQTHDTHATRLHALETGSAALHAKCAFPPVASLFVEMGFVHGRVCVTVKLFVVEKILIS
jgi:hypothetical protein